APVVPALAPDGGVTGVTPAMMARTPAAAAVGAAPVEEIEDAIRTLGLYRTKARHLRALAEALVARYAGEVPKGRDALEALPGVGRKTASVVLATAFGVPALAVDTHVARVARRLDLSRGRTAAAVERDLCRRVPRREWIWLHHALIRHGRRVCRARRPACEACALAPHCPRLGVAPPAVEREWESDARMRAREA
ncbi:MAG: endonuclease III, partial [Firmicutes bacterium]|nr:endonuclease III [Bacillota bacterium]